MIGQDIFVGVVAVITGLFVFVSALLNSEWVGRFWIARHIESSSNGSVSRFAIMAIGALCIVLGTLLLLGFFPSERATTSQRQTAGPPIAFENLSRAG